MKLILLSLIWPTLSFGLPKHHSMFGFSKALENGVQLLPNQPTWQAPDEGDARSPCPMLNSLANHGVLPHSGRQISKDTLVSVLTEFMLLDQGVSSFLADQALQLGYEIDGTHYFDLDGLQKYVRLSKNLFISKTRRD
jgi:hypothetical protein